MLQDYKHLATGRKTRKQNKPYVLRVLIISGLLVLLVWLLTLQTENNNGLQFSFFKEGEIHYDFSNFATGSRDELQKRLQERFKAASLPVVNSRNIPTDNDSSTVATNKPDKSPITVTVNNSAKKAPESKNISKKTTPTPVKQFTWHSVIIEPGHTLNQIGIELKLSRKDMGLLLVAAKKHRRQLILKPGRQIRFQLRHPSRQLHAISYALNSKKHFTLRKNGPGFNARTHPIMLKPQLARISATINKNLFDTNGNTNIPESLLLQMAAVFNWDVDFTADLHKGDSFTILYEQYKSKDGNSHGNLVAASITINDITRFAFRYTNPRGHTAWYNQNAELLKKLFLRTPLRLTQYYYQGKNLRLLKNSKTSIRYKVPEGTPVKTTAYGRIIFMGNKGRFGKTVIVRHRKGYTTLYAHLSRFRKHLRPGRKVSQGQVIAYVGKSGRTDNAQLHYELRLRGKHLNPLANNVSRHRKISRRWRKDFLKKSAQLRHKLEAQ